MKNVNKDIFLSVSIKMPWYNYFSQSFYTQSLFANSGKKRVQKGLITSFTLNNETVDSLIFFLV